jgi:hypothetical protein
MLSREAIRIEYRPEMGPVISKHIITEAQIVAYLEKHLNGGNQ